MPLAVYQGVRWQLAGGYLPSQATKITIGNIIKDFYQPKELESGSPISSQLTTVGVNQSDDHSLKSLTNALLVQPTHS